MINGLDKLRNFMTESQMFGGIGLARVL